MTKQMKQPEQDRLTALLERYLGLESLEVTEALVEVCGAIITPRALPLLKQRLKEEEAKGASLQERGYIRMREKSEQVTASLSPLIARLEEMNHDTPN